MLVKTCLNMKPGFTSEWFLACCQSPPSFRHLKGRSLMFFFPFLFCLISSFIWESVQNLTLIGDWEGRDIQKRCILISTNKKALQFPLILTDGHYLAKILKIPILNRVKLFLSIKPSESNTFTQPLWRYRAVWSFSNSVLQNLSRKVTIFNF